MALFPIVVAGVQIGLIDTNDRFSKDPGPNTAPTAGPNTPVPSTGGEKTVQLLTLPSTGANILGEIANPG